MLIGWRAANNHIRSSWAKYSWADNMVQVAKNEMWVSEVCFACLTRLYGLFVRTLISLTNAYAGCGRSTLNSIERFWLGSVRSASKLNAKWTQMNYEMNCINMHKCTEMYSKQPEYTGECQSCFLLNYNLIHTKNCWCYFVEPRRSFASILLTSLDLLCVCSHLTYQLPNVLTLVAHKNTL